MVQRISRYYPGFDGTRLAVDLYLPQTEEKVPVLFQAANGPRRGTGTPSPMESAALAEYEWFLDRGYAVCRVDPRGVGASFGVSEGFWSLKDGLDMKAIIDSVASESWCSGSAGMYGGSNMGAVQQLAVWNRPDHLRCVIPCDCSADFYYQNYPNGVSIIPETPRPKMRPIPGAPVDEDEEPDHPLARAAMECHERNLGFLEQYYPNMHRDDASPKIGYAPNMELPLWEHMDAVRHGNAAYYAYGSWFDPGCSNKIFEFKRFGGKLLLGPWRHMEVYRGCDFPQSEFDWKADHLAFFDRYLKNAPSDIDQMPPVRYYTVGDEDPWHFAADFPLDSQTNPQLRLTASGGIVDRAAEPGTITYKVRNDITVFDSMGRLNRRLEKDMNAENEKCVLFTSDPLPGDLELTGFPVAELYATSTYKDGIFMALLEEVTPDGVSRAITDGMLRGRSARLGRNPAYDALGLPYHSSMKRDDVQLSPDKPTLLAFHLETISRIVKAGSRLRLAVYCGGNGFNQPEGMPEDVTVTFHFGGSSDALLRLPVIAPNVTKFEGDGETVYAFKRAVYRHRDNCWKEYPCQQVFPAADGLHFVTKDFTAVRSTKGDLVTLSFDGFTGTGKLPRRMTFSESSTEIVSTADHGMRDFAPTLTPTFRNLYIATVPCQREQPGQMNPQPRNTLDLFTDVILPEGEGPFPCIVHIHGFGGSSHQYEAITPRLLERGYACASIDYRLMPPNIWPSSAMDARACVRYLKAHAKDLRLDPHRFGLIGSSMGGHLVTMLAACNGDPACEGDIGGNTECNCSVKAAVALFPVTDFFRFGEDCGEQWPWQPDRIAYGDGPAAPLGSMLGWTGPGRGMGDIKHHLFDADPKYQALIALAKDASSVYHVTERSAPVCFVHGISECGIQVPMGQSVRMFEALTRKGVKSLLLCSNLGVYGADPEVRTAMVEFLCSRV